MIGGWDRPDDPAQAAVEQLCATALEALGARRIVVWRHVQSSRLVSPVAGAGSEESFSLRNLACRWSQRSVEDIPMFERTLQQRRPVVVAAAELEREAPMFARELLAGSVWCEPLVVSQPVGILTVEPAPAPSAGQAITRIATSMAALLTWQGAERGRAQAELLLELIEAASSHSGSIGALLGTVCERLASKLDVTRASIFLRIEERLVPRMSCFADGHPDPDAWARFRAATEPLAIVDAVFASQRPLSAVHRQDPRLSDWWSVAFGTQAALAVPLGASSDPVGVLILDSTTPRAFRKDEVRLVAAAGAMLGQVVHRAREAEEREKINHALAESEAKFRGLVSQSLVGIVLIEDGKFSYSNTRYDEMFGYSADEVRNLGPVDVAIESDRALVAENLRQRVSGEVDHVDYVFRGLRKDGAVVDFECHGSSMDVDGKLILISLLLDITERTRAERELQALQARLRDQSTHDALTGLYNRRYLEETLCRELILAERHGHPVSLIMGDLDRFKAVNDRLGHLAGDEVLRVVGDILKRQARGSDIYCRYGGEEFLLVLPGMPEASAVERAELLRSAIASAPVAYGVSEIAVTASFGIASFPRHGRTADELIAAADSALYAAKTAGRNRVSLTPPRPSI